MEGFETLLKTAIENKQFLESKSLSNIADYFGNNKKSLKLNSFLYEYLKIFPQHIIHLPSNLFDHIPTMKHEPLHPLYSFVASKHTLLNEKVVCNLNLHSLPTEKWAYLMAAFYKRLDMIMFNPEFVEKSKSKIDFYNMLIDCPNWFIDNEDFFMALHFIEFDEDECYELFDKLSKNWSEFKINQASVSFVDLVATKCDKEIEFIQFLMSALFSLPLDSYDMPWMSNKIISILKIFDPKSFVQLNDWDAIIKKALKFGLADENPKYELIKVLRKLIKNTSVEKSILLNTFNLLTGHSQFSNIMINRNANQAQKEEVLKLLEVLVKKDPTLMTLSHVPFFLCSYNASMSVNDQLLLRLLSLYEENSIPISNYRPYLWGSYAVAHYQVKSHLESRTLHDFPSTSEVISYVPLKRLKETLSYFPVERLLHIRKQKIIYYDKSKDPSNMLDPAFFLPMISSLLSTEAPLSIEKFTRSGCLSMILACLGSGDSDIRIAAYHVLTILRSHLFCRRAENMLWDHFISWVAFGIQDLKLQPPPQLPMIQALFLGRMVLAIANHEKGIDVTCCKILLARPSARLCNIPEMKAFMTTVNIDIDKTRHIRWLFEVIRDGIRSNLDWQTMKNMELLNVFLIILSCSNEKNRMLVMKIMERAFRVQPATNGGSGPWALSLMTALSKIPTKLSNEEVIQVFCCLNALSANSSIIPATIDFWLYMFLLYGNDSEIAVKGFASLANLSLKYSDTFCYLNKENLLTILSCGKNSKVLSDDELFKCNCIIEHGVNSVEVENFSTYLFLPALIKGLKNQYHMP
ncbi:nucleolar pre-ribosomal-associated protein 1 [Daktulosphaira vitifoliae]|uniref:nucleolar pre-ribosomal-associated protein 1 n=1 Tax=Daktulosphaira vitifoliae TaxID=58002 RepID=UPI0021A9D5B9|nr:nucleolar pre-ribosomal-associated protein 1 [Daktulosphaira vitifoliae]